MSFTCPKCGRTSHNPNDEREGYCGNCHDWTGLFDVNAPSDEPSTGYAVTIKDRLIIKTVSNSPRAAMVNALYTVGKVPIRDDYDDEKIQRLFAWYERSGWKVVKVDIKIID